MDLTLELVLLKEFAASRGVTYDAVRKWVVNGRYNESRTRLIKLKSRLTPQGRATCNEYYRDFIRALNDEDLDDEEENVSS